MYNKKEKFKKLVLKTISHLLKEFRLLFKRLHKPDNPRQLQALMSAMTTLLVQSRLTSSILKVVYRITRASQRLNRIMLALKKSPINQERKPLQSIKALV